VQTASRGTRQRADGIRDHLAGGDLAISVMVSEDQWRETVQETEMGDIAHMKVGQQRQNMKYFDPDRLWSHS
jgi:hypothetical protein